ncbi:hypothetical protein LguiB_018344 [Lonicera macranthoides]
MGSSYFGEPNTGSERSSSSSSSKKGKKDKPKQPQRGLGVAQLEKIRLNNQIVSTYLQTPPYPYNLSQEDVRLQTGYYSSSSSSSPFSYASQSSSSYGFHGHQSIMMGLGEPERSNFIYGDSQPSINPRWNSSNVLEVHHFAQPSITRPLFHQEIEDSQEKTKKEEGTNDSSGSQDLDLELRLSL